MEGGPREDNTPMLPSRQQAHSMLAQSIPIWIPDIEHSADGIVPINSFPEIPKRVSCVRLATVDGMVPVNWLLSKNKSVSCVRLANVEGMVPFNWFSLKSKDSSCVRLASVDGIVPVNWLNDKSKDISCVNNPISVGMVFPTIGPAKNFLDRHTVTLVSDKKLQAPDNCS